MSVEPGNDTLWGNFGSDLISGGPEMTSSTATVPSHRRQAERRSGQAETTTTAWVGGSGLEQINNCEATTP
jgi:hypothetical protein